jgi:hypothetical protein
MHRADVAQLVEHHLAKVGVAGSNPVVRSEPQTVPRPRMNQNAASTIKMSRMIPTIPIRMLPPRLLR